GYLKTDKSALNNRRLSRGLSRQRSCSRARPPPAAPASPRCTPRRVRRRPGRARRTKRRRRRPQGGPGVPTEAPQLVERAADRLVATDPGVHHPTPSSVLTVRVAGSSLGRAFPLTIHRHVGAPIGGPSI